MQGITASQSINAFSERVRLDSDFESVVQLYWPRIFRFIMASVRVLDVAETLTQDCFWKAYRNAPYFRNECSLDTWLMQIAVNLVRDHGRNRSFHFWRRAQKTAVPVEFVADFTVSRQATPEAAALLKQQLEAVWNCASKLPERQRTVFLLRFVEDMSLLEIAAATGLKEGTVKTHLFRALEVVRGQLGVKQ